MNSYPLFYVNIFARDLLALSDYYQKLFELEEIIESRSEIYRGYSTGGCCLGFNSEEAYELLSLTNSNTQTDSVLATFAASNREDVDARCLYAVDLGGTLVKSPFETYYGWYQGVLRDPEGNPFRINYTPITDNTAS